MGLLSFEDYSNGKKSVKLDENKRQKRSDKRKQKSIIENSKPIFKKLKEQDNKILKVNENSFQVGDNYKVKIVIDVPVSLIKQYSEKVQQDTGKNALENFSEAELAEQIVDYIVKQNLNIDNIPSAVAVGEEIIEQDVEQVEAQASEDADQLEDETMTDTDTESEDTKDSVSDDGMLNMTDNDISFEDDDSEEKIEDGEDLEFEAEETDLGEEIEVEDENTKDKKKDSEEEEESLEGMFKKVLKK